MHLLQHQRHSQPHPSTSRKVHRPPVDTERMAEDQISNLRHTATIINSTLKTRSLLHSKLLFNCLDWEQLVQDQPESLSHLKATPILRANDENILDTLMALIKSIDAQRERHQHVAKSMVEKNKQIKMLEDRVAALERDVGNKDRMIQEQRVENRELNAKVNHLGQLNKTQAQDLTRIKNWCADIEKKYEIESNKKDEEVMMVRRRLANQRNIPTSIEYGGMYNLLDSVVHNSKPYIDNPPGSTVNNPNLMMVEASLKDEINERSRNLNHVVDKLAQENLKLTNYLQATREYYQHMNELISKASNVNNASLVLEEPLDVIKYTNVDVDKSGVKEYWNLETFEDIAPPITQEIYNLYDNIMSLHKLINSSRYNEGSNERAEQLKKELELMTASWKDALKAVEDWKRIANSGRKDLD